MSLIYRALAGSHAYGTNTVDSDFDYVEVHVEEKSVITGLDKYDTEFKSNDGRTLAGGEDTTIYGLQKWAALVAAGNPNMVETLFIQNDVSTYDHRTWERVIENRDAFLSQSAGFRFLGYAQSQQFALMGVKNKRTNRPELVHKHGYDTKYAGHLIRVLVEGIELMRTGSITFPLFHAPYIKDIRAGKVDKDTLLATANDLRVDLERYTENTQLPKKADRARINDLLHGIYLDSWRLHG